MTSIRMIEYDQFHPFSTRMDSGSEKTNQQKLVNSSPHKHIHENMGSTPDHRPLPAQGKKPAAG